MDFGVGVHQYEWQCPELSKRYLFLAFGTAPYSANGKDVVWNYPSSNLEKVTNGTANKGPNPGDVISYNGPTSVGHTSIVSASSIDGNGNGSVTIIEQNYSSSGTRTHTVSNWFVQSNDGVSGWLHQGSGNDCQNLNPSNDQIALFIDPNYGGNTCKILGVGEYSNPTAMGFPNDALSSIKVGSNVTASLCKHDNYEDCYPFAVSDADLSDDPIGDNAVSSVKVIAKSNNGPEGYRYSAKEGEQCSFSGSAELAYGANGNYRYITGSDGIRCDNDTFGGDPEPGVQKSCYIRGGGPPSYTYCSPENGTCSFNGTADVAYGASLVYNYKYGVVGSISCNNDVFGDPIQGVVKGCYYKITVPPTDEALFITQSTYPTVNPGETYQIFFELRNAGNTTWQPGTYWLQNLQHPLGADAQQAISQSVAPNGTYRWTISQVAPGTVGTYRTQWMISHNGETFGPNLFVDVTVKSSIEVNLLMNPGAETGNSTPEAWSEDAWMPSYSQFTWDSTQTHSGNRSLKILSTTANDARWIQTVEVQPNTDYRLSGWIKTENVMASSEVNNVGANLSTLVDLPTNSNGLLGTNDWTFVSYTFYTGSKTKITVSARLGMYSGTTTGTAWFDDLKLELLSTPNCYSLTKSNNPSVGGSIAIDPAPNCTDGTQYIHGTTVKLTATPNNGYEFINWSSIDEGSTNPIHVVMTADKSIVANYSKVIPGSFNKINPANLATKQSINLILSWGSSNGATSYEYCYDTTNDNTCSNWNNNGTATNKFLHLNNGTTYYWQVRAINTSSLTYANSNKWWSFTTISKIDNEVYLPLLILSSYP